MLEAQRLMTGLGGDGSGIADDVLARYGALSEFIQVKGAVALAQIERHGMHLDLERIRSRRERVLRLETRGRGGGLAGDLPGAVQDLQ